MIEAGCGAMTGVPCQSPIWISQGVLVGVGVVWPSSDGWVGDAAGPQANATIAATESMVAKAVTVIRMCDGVIRPR